MSDQSPLSEDQWVELRDGINTAIQTSLNTPEQIQNLKLQIARLVSHVDSERRVNDLSSRQLYDHHQLLHGIGDKDGLKGNVNNLMAAFASIKRLLWGGISMLLVVFIKALWEMAVKSGIKP